MTIEKKLNFVRMKFCKKVMLCSTGLKMLLESKLIRNKIPIPTNKKRETNAKNMISLFLVLIVIGEIILLK